MSLSSKHPTILHESAGFFASFLLRQNFWKAFYGHQTADFIAKLQIASKECSESEYWIELLIESAHYDNRDFLDRCINYGSITPKKLTN